MKYWSTQHKPYFITDSIDRPAHPAPNCTTDPAASLLLTYRTHLFVFHLDCHGPRLHEGGDAHNRGRMTTLELLEVSTLQVYVRVERRVSE